MPAVVDIKGSSAALIITLRQIVRVIITWVIVPIVVVFLAVGLVCERRNSVIGCVDYILRRSLVVDNCVQHFRHCVVGQFFEDAYGCISVCCNSRADILIAIFAQP